MERRHYPRLPLGSPVVLEAQGRTVTATLANVSIRGAKVRWNDEGFDLAVGDTCALVAEGERMDGVVAGVHADGPRIIFR